MFKRLRKKFRKAINKVAEKVADWFESIGNKAADIANSIADSIDQIKKKLPIIGSVVSAAVRWCGRVVSAACDVVASVAKGIAAVLTGVTDFVFGLLSGEVISAFKDLVANIVGGLLIYAGSVVSFLQTFFPIQKNKQKLIQGESDLLRLVFEKSLDLDNIRIIRGRTGSGVYAFTNRPFTMGNIIYMKDTEDDDWNRTLVHEAVHVWQYQNYGSRYGADTLGAQLILGEDRAYKWWLEILPWQNFNAEAEAELFEDVYKYGAHLVGMRWNIGDGGFFNGAINKFLYDHTAHPPVPIGYDVELNPNNLPDYTQLATDAMEFVRSEKNDRI